MCVTDEVECVSVSVSLHSGVEQVPQIWVIWGVMGRAEERQILKAGAGSNWEKRAAACLVLSPACLFLLYFCQFSSRAEEQILSVIYCVPSACKSTLSLPGLFVLSFRASHAVLSDQPCLPLFSQVYTAALVWVFLHCWRYFPHFFSVCLGPGMLEHKLSLCCFLCHRYAMISLHSENTYGYQ